MNTEQKLFGSYLGLSVKQRIYHLMKNYHYRDRYVECYRQYVEGMIADIRAYECRQKDDIGVRIMSGGNNSNATARLAEDAVKISNVFITGHIGESLIKDKEDNHTENQEKKGQGSLSAKHGGLPALPCSFCNAGRLCLLLHRRKSETDQK